MVQSQKKILLRAKLQSLHNWVLIAAPVCLKCKASLRWDQRRFWEESSVGRVYFFCDCGFENPLPYLRFKWDILQELQDQNISLK